jgi:hypothetical protein
MFVTVSGTWTALKDCTVHIRSPKSVLRGPNMNNVAVGKDGVKLELKKGQTIFCIEFDIEVI